jgi:hypothetical protein
MDLSVFVFFLTNVHHFEWKKLKNMKGRLLTAKVKGERFGRNDGLIISDRCWTEKIW